MAKAKNRLAYYKAERERCKKAGLCTTCRKRPARPNRTKCVECATKQNKYIRALFKERREQGLCIECGLDLKGEPLPIPMRCRFCNDRAAELIYLWRSL